MTRRLSRASRLLSINAYIHRATLGLPKAERLDAAAELRAHLLERTAEHESQGFSREEAEFLAVKGMGDPQPVNRSLLGHALTHKAGWLVLALLVAGGGGWWAYREWMPPRVGVSREEFTADDAKLLFTYATAPRGHYDAYNITYPKGTQSIVAAFISEDMRQVQVLDLSQISGKQRINAPGSYRYQQRWLINGSVSAPESLPWYPQCKNLGIYFLTPEIPSALIRNQVGAGQMGGLIPYGACYEADKKLAAQLPLTQQADWMEQPMALNHWSLVFSGAAGFDNIDRSLYIVVMPLEYSLKPKAPFFEVNAGRLRINGDTRDLPPLPALP
jgi:hypothetical protein